MLDDIYFPEFIAPYWRLWVILTYVYAITTSSGTTPAVSINIAKVDRFNVELSVTL